MTRHQKRPLGRCDVCGKLVRSRGEANMRLLINHGIRRHLRCTPAPARFGAIGDSR